MRARDNAECYINDDDNLVFEGTLSSRIFPHGAGWLVRWEACWACWRDQSAGFSCCMPQHPLPSGTLAPASRCSYAGAVYSRNGLAEVGAKLALKEAAGLGGCEGLVLRALSLDEHAYTCVLRTSAGHSYSAKFNTRLGYNTLRLPFNQFRALSQEDPPLQPGGCALTRVAGRLWACVGRGRGRGGLDLMREGGGWRSSTEGSPPPACPPIATPLTGPACVPSCLPARPPARLPACRRRGVHGPAL
jgi:hypothetical protein